MRIVLGLVASALLWPSFAMAEEPSGRPVTFHNTLSTQERKFLQTSSLFNDERADWLNAVKRGEVHWAEADLNGDGRPERLIILQNVGWCGSAGCLMRILRQKAGKWRLLSDSDGEAGYIQVLPQTDGGWHRIGYGREAYYWNGCEYINREMAEQDRRDGLDPCRQ